MTPFADQFLRKHGFPALHGLGVEIHVGYPADKAPMETATVEVTKEYLERIESIARAAVAFAQAEVEKRPRIEVTHARQALIEACSA